MTPFRANARFKLAVFILWATCLPSMAVAGEAQTADDNDAPPAATRQKDDWLVGDLDRSSWWVTAGLALGLGVYYSTADSDDIQDLGDLTQLIPGAFALTGILATGDRQGLKQFGFVAGTTVLTTHGLKEIVDKSRPDESASTSFPSGHTAASVMGASFLWRRYGPKWGMPSTILAVYTGVSRIEGQKHFADDVISGAALGLISNWLWTDPIDDRVRMSLFPTDGGAGVQFEYDPAAVRRGDSETEETDTLPTRLFLWEIGLTDVSRNRVIAPNPGGDPIDWQFDRDNNPNVTALVSVSWRRSQNSRHGFGLAFAPFEVRETVTPETDLNFGGDVFPAGTSVRSRYIAYDYRAGYGYALFTSDRYRLSLLASLAVFDTELKLETMNSETKVRDSFAKPNLGARFAMIPADRWMIYASYNTWQDSEFSIKDFTTQVVYRIDSSWALSLGYRFVDREVDIDELFNDVHRKQIALGVWYSW